MSHSPTQASAITFASKTLLSFNNFGEEQAVRPHGPYAAVPWDQAKQDTFWERVKTIYDGITKYLGKVDEANAPARGSPCQDRLRGREYVRALEACLQDRNNVMERYWRVEEHLKRLIGNLQARGMPKLFESEITTCLDDLRTLPSSVVVEGIDFHLGKGSDIVTIRRSVIRGDKAKGVSKRRLDATVQPLTLSDSVSVYSQLELAMSASGASAEEVKTHSNKSAYLLRKALKDARTKGEAEVVSDIPPAPHFGDIFTDANESGRSQFASTGSRRF
jgi:hypothetical protein